MYPHYGLVDFTATRKPVGAKGHKDDRFNGATTIRDANTGSTGTIVSDVTPSKVILKEIQAHGRGLTRSNNPWWGYVAPDVDQLNAPDTSQVIYPQLYGALPFFKTQMHELGGALGSYELLRVPILDSISVSEDEIIVCGGEARDGIRNRLGPFVGIILRSSDAGKTWSVIYKSPSLKVSSCSLK